MTSSEALIFILSGFAVVLVALALLWLVSAVIGRMFTSTPRKEPAPAPAAPPAAPQGIPPAHLAAIGAAVAVLTGGQGRIVRVLAPPQVGNAWAANGRAEQIGSHRVRWHWKVAERPPQVEDEVAAAPAADSKRTS